jgi:hypothetical protein
MSDSTDEAIQLIEQQLDDITIDRLALHAARKLGRHHWQGVRGGPVPGGLEVLDFVYNAIQKTLIAVQCDTGGRKWDPVTQPDLFKHLRSVIDSDISCAVNSWQNRYFRSETTLDGFGPEGGRFRFVDFSPSEAPDPAECCMAAEQECMCERVLRAFYHFLADDPELEKIFDLMREGVFKAEDQARRLEVSSEAIYNLRKQMGRRFIEFQKQNKALLSEARPPNA